MSEEEARNLLNSDLKFTESDIAKLDIFRKLLLSYNARYNLISKNTENSIWTRHILDSAQLVKYINFDFRNCGWSSFRSCSRFKPNNGCSFINPIHFQDEP
jgi:16S rRNA G527 N7-methylase RsmG